MTPRPRSTRQGDLFGAPIPPTAPPADRPPAVDSPAVDWPEVNSREVASPEATPTPAAGLPLLRRQLLDWQERLAAYQAPLWIDDNAGDTPSPAPAAAPGSGAGGREAEQASLFAEEGGGGTPAAIDPAARARALRPLALPAQNLSFWRWPEAPHQGAALYFVVDRPVHLGRPLLLYVGETARADRRWKGAHDCKSYLSAYQEALARADLTAGLSIRFCCDAPAATAMRRAWEQALIQRWKPPFNKETRARWNTPFTADLD
ncbi:MAG: GIY-YIG nuclease family protein [Cyanobacteriota bacterium]|nr:GIY-YIG nuclease family protein [Cyanobacteriota bacterium]